MGGVREAPELLMVSNPTYPLKGELSAFLTQLVGER